MKKRLLALSLCLGMVAVAMTGCGKSDEKEKETTAEKKVEWKYTFEKADYFGLEVEESDATVSEEELEEYIQSDLEANSTSEEVTEGVLEAEMDVKIDYVGKVDGTEYTSNEDTVVSLTEGGFALDGFTDALIGKSVGEEVEVTLTFPEDYEDADYVGKDIVFTVTIDAIVVTTVPELNDEYVQEVYNYLGISTVDEYKEEYSRTIRINKIYEAVWDTLLDNVEIEAYDSVELESAVTAIEESMEYQLSQSSMDLATYLEYVGQTEEEYSKECEDSAKEEIKFYLVRDLIAEAEDITISDEEYTEELKKTMVAYDMETEEEFYEYFAAYGYDEAFFRDNFLTNKVVEFVAENIVVVPDKEEETSAQDETVEGETTEASSEEETSAQEETSAE